MDWIRSWIEGIAFAAILGAVVVTLTPEGGMEKSVRTVVSLFLLCMLALPLFRGNLTLDVPELPPAADTQTGAAALLDTAAHQAEAAVREQAAALLKKEGISYTDIRIDMEVNEADAAVNVRRVEILAPGGDADAIRSQIETRLGIPAIVRTEETE